MKYYATVAASSQSCQDTVDRIEKRVLDSNPIMEAFGEPMTFCLFYKGCSVVCPLNITNFVSSSVFNRKRLHFTE